MATVQLTIEKFVYKHDVVVVPRFGYEVVLGLDFLLASELCLNISCGHITLTFANPDLEPSQQNEEIPEINLFHELTFSNSEIEPVDNLPKVHLIEPVEVKPWSDITLIQLYAPEPIEVGEVGIIEVTKLFSDKYQLFGDTVLVTVPCDHLIPYIIRNNSDQAITLYPGTSPGKFSELDEGEKITPVNALEPIGSKSDAFDLATSSLSSEEQEQLHQLLEQNRDVFAFNSKQLGRMGIVQHVIDMGGSLPIRQRPYRVGPATQKEINSQIEEMLANDVIQPSVSPWASPVVLVTKKDGKKRFCIDFRKLNAVTSKDSYPLLRIDDTLNRLQGTRYFQLLISCPAIGSVKCMSPPKRRQLS